MTSVFQSRYHCRENAKNSKSDISRHVGMGERNSNLLMGSLPYRWGGGAGGGEAACRWRTIGMSAVVRFGGVILTAMLSACTLPSTVGLFHILIPIGDGLDMDALRRLERAWNIPQTLNLFPTLVFIPASPLSPAPLTRSLSKVSPMFLLQVCISAGDDSGSCTHERRCH